ncbi:pyridine nucleotide-disulfide oxidoreductase [Aphanothece hegewaldii CCALA 016]|uniref:Pyridine nucleotide-disulfide oxidoreductase n=1 Tax=Aphanothece hegewaldii CCALA 016 TaxID=2107694 RepID=A0A2T1M2V4_9CHRO|nr:mercuric reductase [Aphanothece hegewaldii]PSF39091.1 pyridine nucleotide-disulfide oxidoreductase [Aphanothece hegewaldii CCALA 016]
MTVEYDLVVIGGGSAGLVVASAASQTGAKVALVEKHRLGGDCLWFGCVPSKSLIQASRIAYSVKHSDRFGIYTQPPDIDFTKTIHYVQDVIRAIEPNDSPERFRGLGVNVIFGDGQFIDSKTFLVDGQKLTARAFVIATGSRPTIPDIEGLKEAGYLTNEQVFTLNHQPKSLAIIGAGPIGCELGQAFHRLGTEVILISSQNGLLSKEDPEVAQVVEQQFIKEGISIINNSKVVKIEINHNQKVLDLGNTKISVDEILVSAGRTPNLESLNLEAAGVEFNNKGVQVNSKLQTTNPKIYACGDVIGGYQFTHVAGYEASIVIQNALFFPLKKTNYRVIPWTTFTEPEVARVGLTEKQAKEQYKDVIVLKQDFYHVDRAQAENATEGFAKIITRSNGEILGGHIVGVSAGEIIHEIVLAMTHKLPVSALSGIHVYPTLSEVNSKAALLFTKQKYAKNVRLQNILKKFFSLLRGWSR